MTRQGYETRDDETTVQRNARGSEGGNKFIKCKWEAPKREVAIGKTQAQMEGSNTKVSLVGSGQQQAIVDAVMNFQNSF